MYSTHQVAQEPPYDRYLLVSLDQPGRAVGPTFRRQTGGTSAGGHAAGRRPATTPGHLPPEPAKFKPFFNPSFLEEGIAIQLMLALPGKMLIDIDKSSSKYTLTDDQGQTLEPATAFGGKTPYFETSFSEKRTRLMCTIGSPTPPTRGARHVHIRGQIKVVCATGQKTSPLIDLPTNKGGTFKVGPHTFKLIESKMHNENGKAVRLVRLEIGRTGHLIDMLEFIEATGKPVEVRPASRMTLNGVETRDYHLDPSPGKLQLRVRYFDKTESAMVPLDLKIGVGLE